MKSVTHIFEGICEGIEPLAVRLVRFLLFMPNNSTLFTMVYEPIKMPYYLTVNGINNIQEEIVNANADGRNGQSAEAGAAGSEINLLDYKRGLDIGNQAERVDAQRLREREEDYKPEAFSASGKSPAKSWLGVDHTRLCEVYEPAKMPYCLTGLVAFYYAHEYAHNNGNDNAIQAAGRRVWQEMQGEGSDALDRYCKKWGEDPNDPKTMNEFIADIRGAYEYAIQNNYEVHDQLELTAEEAKRFYKAFAEVDGQGGISSKLSQLTDFSNYKIKNTKKDGATPLSRGLTPHGAGSVGLTERFMTAASTLGMNNLSNVDEKVKNAIVKLADAYESAKNNTPIGYTNRQKCRTV